MNSDIWDEVNRCNFNALSGMVVTEVKRNRHILDDRDDDDGKRRMISFQWTGSIPFFVFTFYSFVIY